MAITIVRKRNVQGEMQNLMFRTENIYVESPEGDGEMIEKLTGKAVLVDDNLNPLTEPSYYDIGVTEEEFHKDLRRQAAEKDQLLTSHSTDPEWNPDGYSKNMEDELS